jgi:hypothetical protein
MSETLVLILGSAAVGALISSIVNGVFNWWAKKAELERLDMEMALKMAELKHQQLVITHEWYAKQGKDRGVDFFDPLVSVIDYCDGMKKYRKTGRWPKGEAGHRNARSSKESSAIPTHGSGIPG